MPLDVSGLRISGSGQPTKPYEAARKRQTLVAHVRWLRWSAIEDLAHNAQEQVILVDTAIWLLCAKSGLNLGNADLAQLAGTTTDGLVALIESWMQEDPTEQRETFDHLVRGLNENRRGGRELFPEALKGKTW